MQFIMSLISGDNKVLTLVFCIIFSITCSAKSVNDDYSKEKGNELTGYSSMTRQKRAAKIIGTALRWFGQNAFKKVLLGAKLMHTDDGTKWFLKAGGYRKALSDFYSLKPTQITKPPEGTGFIGMANGRTVSVFYRLSNSKAPLLCINKKQGIRPDTIIEYLE